MSNKGNKENNGIENNFNSDCGNDCSSVPDYSKNNDSEDNFNNSSENNNSEDNFNNSCENDCSSDPGTNNNNENSSNGAEADSSFKKIYIAFIAAATAIVAGLIVVFLIYPAQIQSNNNYAASVNTDAAGESETLQIPETTAAQTFDNPKDKTAAEEVEANAEKKVYLTFDDGPSANTDKILDVLKANNIKATFFLIKGSDTDIDKDRIRRIYNEGHTLAIHSTNHDYSELYADMDSFKKDVTDEKNYLKELTGVDVKFYRFPGGSSNTVYKKFGIASITECIEWLHSEGLEYFDWNVSSADSEGIKYSPSQIASNVVDDITHQENMVLLHDSPAKVSTEMALQSIIDEICEKGGYTFCQITDNTVPVQHLKL